MQVDILGYSLMKISTNDNRKKRKRGAFQQPTPSVNTARKLVDNLITSSKGLPIRVDCSKVDSVSSAKRRNRY